MTGGSSLTNESGSRRIVLTETNGRSIIVDDQRLSATEIGSRGGSSVVFSAGLPISNVPFRGVMIRIAPDDTADWDSYVASRYGGTTVDGESAPQAPGMHRTATIDLTIIVDGELLIEAHEGSTVVRAGDVVVIEHAAHRWVNRSNDPATILAVMVTDDHHQHSHAIKDRRLS
jgi:hypothetical protein